MPGCGFVSPPGGELVRKRLELPAWETAYRPNVSIEHDNRQGSDKILTWPPACILCMVYGVGSLEDFTMSH